jgi:two-component system phosphate regulon response regulator PhoB
MTGPILIVEDERDLAGALEVALAHEGYQTRSAASGRLALELAVQEPVPQLVLLDLMLPDLPGTEVCRRLRQDERTRGVGVIMLTARAEEIDRVVGFEVGADDFVAKPFSVRELLLRIRAVLTRLRPDERTVSAPIEFERLRVEIDAHQVWVDGAELALTPLEFRLLTTLLTRRGRVQTRATLLSDVWGMHADLVTRTVDTHVKRLREKLGAAGEYVETIRGVGYRFRSADPLDAA